MNHEYRRQNYELDADQETVREAFADFFQKEVPSTLVRAAEPLGYDAELWGKAVEVGLTAMAAPEDAGGDGAGIVEMAIVMEELGRTVAPIPLAEHVVAMRLLAAAGDPAHAELLEAAVEGERILGIALRPLTGRAIVPTAAVAEDVIALHDGRLVLVSSDGAREHVPNQSSLPFAWVDPAAERVTPIATGDPAGAFDLAAREWKVLTASALTGMTAAALSIAVEFAKTRETMGTLIGKLQGVQFPLADVHMWVGGTRNLVRRAAWFLDHEPDVEPHLPAAAMAYAAQTATRGTGISAHLQGGLGFIRDSDAAMYFLRAKGWALGAGDPVHDLRTVGRMVLDARRAERAAATVSETTAA